MQRVCIASFDIIGPIRNGGIGTAMTSLAEMLAQAGHDVTLLYPSSYSETRSLTEITLEYRHKNIKFECLFASNGEPELSYRVYHWLKERAFDVIHFHDWRGVGYWSFVAKHQGLAFKDTVLVCQTHGQTFWHTHHSGEFVHTLEELRFDYMERRSVELADVVYSPSRYMLKWIESRGWAPPKTSFVTPNLLPAAFPVVPDGGAKGKARVRELVLFGRLETRKGLEIFCCAITKALASGVEFERITFLGKEGYAGVEPAAAYILQATKGWTTPFQILNNYDIFQANDYLRQEGRLAIIASTIENSPYTVLEALASGLPFLATDVGGTRELIAPECADAVLFQPNVAALAALIVEVARNGAVVPTPCIPMERNRQIWRAWHESLKATPRAPAIVDSRPLVSVCMSHFSRPKLLDVAIRSIERQGYERIELVLVDDASPGEETRAYLDSIAARFAARSWKILRNAEEMWTGAARNHAVANSNGDYVLLMDDDNVAKPHEVETFVHVALHTGADVLTCQQQPFASHAEPPPFDADLPLGWLPHGPDLSFALYENCLGDLNMMVRRKAWDALGGFSPDRYGCEDYEFLMKALVEGYKLECLPELLFYYRHGDANLAQRYDQIALYNSFTRHLRPLTAHTPPDLKMAFAYASGVKLHNLKQNKQAYWAPRGDADPQAAEIAGLPLNDGSALTALARAAYARGQAKSAHLLYLQAAKMPRPTGAALAGVFQTWTPDEIGMTDLRRLFARFDLIQETSSLPGVLEAARAMIKHGESQLVCEVLRGLLQRFPDDEDLRVVHSYAAMSAPKVAV